MKRREIILVGVADAVPVACGMIATVCSMMTAYRIEFSLLPLILFCAFAALLLSFWMNVPRYGFGFGALFLTCVIMVCAFRMRQVGEGAVTFAYRFLDAVPDQFSRLFDLGSLTYAAAQVEDPKGCLTLFLMLLAAINGVVLAFALIRSKTVLLPLLLPLPMLLAGLAYTNMQPAIWTTVLIAVYFGYALTGNGLRKSEAPGRGALFAILAPALLLFALLVLAVFPQKSFDPITAESRRNYFADRLSPLTDTAMSWVGMKNPRDIDLMNTGDREDDDKQLFSVYAVQGTHLLRTHSYGAYRNSRWQAAPKYRGDWDSMQALGIRQEKTDTIMWIFDSISNERVAPYAWTDEPAYSDPAEQTGVPVAEESYIRAGGWKDYSWRYTAYYKTKPRSVTEEEREYYETFAKVQYVMADGAEKDALLSIAKEAGLKNTGDALETANAVAAYVRNSGTYSKTPGKTPRGRDFVLYFLTESHRGYCVHFASATTALLQAMGVPARYTVGYCAEVPPGMSREKLPVTGNDAHAWTEVYVPGLGWVPVDSTPGDAFTRSAEGTASPQTGSQPTNKPSPTASSAPASTPSPTPAAGTNEPTQKPASEPTEAPGRPEDPSPAPGVPENGGGEAPEGVRNTKKRGGARWILIPLVPALWTAAGIFVRKRREARFNNADVKRSIPDMARYLAKLERFGIRKDPDAEDWALEAAFSNHRMKAEHKELLRRVHAAQRALYTDKPARGFLLRWVLFVI